MVWSKMKVSFWVSSQSILNPENFVNKYWIVQKLDHLTCIKCLFMTLLYHMYKPINFIPAYSQNSVTCQMV